jgi:hypothetical protein
MVLPGTGMSCEQFRNDDAICQQYAFSQVGGTTANQAAMNSKVTSAAAGTALGAAAGGRSNRWREWCRGAGSGLVAGSNAGMAPQAAPCMQCNNATI